LRGWLSGRSSAVVFGVEGKGKVERWGGPCVVDLVVVVVVGEDGRWQGGEEGLRLGKVGVVGVGGVGGEGAGVWGMMVGSFTVFEVRCEVGCWWAVGAVVGWEFVSEGRLAFDAGSGGMRG
jgi:hypothetical protein